MSALGWLRNFWDRHGPARRLIVVEGDTLPSRLPRRNIVLAREDGDDWTIGFRCPCGCGETIELAVIEGARPRWDFSADAKGKPTLSPSVWRQIGCRSHFWLRGGRIQWCK
jgi:hypothetical protein